MQVRKPQIESISADNLLARLRKRLLHARQPKGSLFHRKRRRDVGKQRRSSATRTSSRTVRKSALKSGGGGAWRAYVSHHTSGHAFGSWSFGELAQTYNSLAAWEKSIWIKKGAGATARHKAGGTSFGFNIRKNVRQAARNSFQRAVDRARGAGAASMVHATAATALTMPAASLGAAQKSTRQASRALRRARREDDNVAAAALAQWRQQEGMTQRNGVVHRLPALAPLSYGLTGEPCLPGVSVVCMTCPLGDEVERAMGLWTTPSGSASIEALGGEWNRLHEVFVHDQQYALPAEPKVNYRTKPSCLKAQYCLCGERGAAIWMLKLWFCIAMKRMLSDKVQKDDLDNGFTILRVTCFHDASASTFNGDDEDEFASPEDWFMHVSFMTWSPHRPISAACHGLGRSETGLGA